MPDRPRSHRPATYSADAVATVIATALTKHKHPFHWAAGGVIDPVERPGSHGYQIFRYLAEAPLRAFFA